MRMRWLLGLLVAVFFVGCDEAATPESNLESSQSAIINGDTETGWPAVGALTLWYPGYGYQGEFCTATLIAPQWILTAAHCLTEQEGMSMDPDIVYFMVGNDARPDYQGNPTNGTLYDVDMFYIHPNYDPNDAYTEADIGLVHLAQPITGVSTLPINTSYMGASWVGSELFYVGFGVTSGTAQEGSGLKRSTYMPVESVGSNYYYSQFDGSGICFGDSGGPGIGNISGTNKVVGVNSSVAGTGYDPCQGTSLQTRVDVYSSWITGITGGTPPNCNSLLDLCMCDGACQANGTCNNDVCKTLDCEAIYMCMVDCPATDVGCQAECYAGGTSLATSQLDSLFSCMSNYCESVSDSQFQTCLQNNCSNEIDTCMPTSTGNLNCEDTYYCMVDCNPSDQQCPYDCYGTATSQAQAQLDALFACMSDQCDGLPDDQYSQCVYDKCESELYTCMPADNCDIAGGDCAPGTACYPAGDGVTNCYDSSGIGAGGACDPNLTDSLACADGLICISDGGNALCIQMCVDNYPCSSGESCKGPIFSGIADIGICLCTDGDNDGVCADEDCDDSNSSVYPGANEICDGKDNNCNSQTDEGCPDDCVDLDADNVCAQDDCNDNNASIYPGAPEVCNDGIDNNCDGQADEGCDIPCEDHDADGFCVSVDCNDNDNSVFPNAGELCDGKDNNCNALVDEGCQDDPDVQTQDDTIQQQEDVIAQQEDTESQTDANFDDPSNDPNILTKQGGCSHSNTPTSTTPTLLLLTLLALVGIRRFAA